MSGLKQAWVTFVPNDESSADAIVLAKSLRLTCTNKSIVALVHQKTSSALRKMMREVFDIILVLPVEMDHPLLSVQYTSAQMYCFSLTFFEKVFFLDSKCMVLKNCDELFNMDGVVVGYTEEVEDLEVDVCGFSPSLELYLDVLNSGWHKTASIYITCDHMTKSFWSYIMSNCEMKFLEPGYTFTLSATREPAKYYLNELPPIVKIEGEEHDTKCMNAMKSSLYKEIMSCHNYLANDMTSLYPNPLHLASWKNEREPIAIIGISCRLPLANNLDEFWDLLVNEQNCMQTIPSNRWTKEQSCITDKKIRNMKVGFLKCPIDEFDAEFFNISPMELSYTDPQQRLLLEVTYEALEDAGIDTKLIAGSRTGVFNGIWTNEYKELMIESGFKGNEFYRSYMGNAFGTSSGRIAHYFGVTGPNVTAENGCSSSLVATGLACESLRNRSSDMAIASGVNLILRPFHYETTLHIHSPTCQSQPFDASADGYGRSEGVAVIVLKRLSDAVRDRDNIYAVIKGYGTSQEGASKSMGTPTVVCEATAMQLALKDANISPSDVDYLEAHATGTGVGDPIEFNAISEVFSTDRNQPLVIGALKSNIGHTESCSGLAAVLRTVLALKKETIPPIFGLKAINPKIKPENIPSIIPLKAIKWSKSSKRTRIAGINNFGITGTDTHLILEEAPRTSNNHFSSDVKHPTQILTISAKTELALNKLIDLYENYLASTSNEIEDISYTANIGRAHFEHRIAVIGETTSEMLFNIRKKQYETQNAMIQSQYICFLYSGQGSQYHGMGKQLYSVSSIFRKHFDICDILLQKNYSIDVKEAIWGKHNEAVHESLFSQTSVFVIEYCITKIWESWGVKPTVVVGHSLGEFAAAVTAGYLTLENALQLVATRANLLCEIQRGKMIAVKYNSNRIFELLKDFYKLYPNTWLDVAAINSRNQTTLAGRENTVELFSNYCRENSIKAHILNATHAYHSRDMDCILSKFSETEKLIKYNKPVCSYVSGFLGELQGSELDKDYWIRNAREPVKFIKASLLLKDLGYKTFIEIGPQAILSALILQNIKEENESIPVTCFSSISLRKGDWNTILKTLQKLYVSGVTINWKGFYQSQTRKKLRLPFYPFQREKYWFNTTINTKLDQKQTHPLLGSRFSTPRNEQIFEKRLIESSISYLSDHKIENHTIFPAAGYLEMAVAAGKLLDSELYSNGKTEYSCLIIKDFQIFSPLEILKEEFCKLQSSVISVCDAKACSSKWLQISIHSEIFGDCTSENNWKNHAEAKLVLGDLRSNFQNDTTYDFKLLLDDTNALSQKTLYENFAALGYNFGPHFQSIKRLLRLNPDNVLAEIMLKDLKQTQYIIHPILLDAMIQVSLVSSFDKISALYLPIAVESLVYCRNPTGKQYFVSSNKTRKEIILYNSNGTAIVQMIGVEFVKTTVETVLTTLGLSYGLLPEMFQEHWKIDKAYDSNEVYTNTSVLPTILVTESSEVSCTMECQEDLQKLEAIISVGIARSLMQLRNKPFKAGEKIHVNEMMHTLSIKNEFRKILRRFMEILTEDGYLQESELFQESFTVIKDFPTIENATLQIQKALEKRKQIDVMWKFTFFYLQNMSDFLVGKVPILRALFPEKETEESLEIMYNHAENFRLTNMILLEKLKKLVANRNIHDTIKILEIGGGTAGTTKWVLPQLEQMKVNFLYEFTDISTSFFSSAEKTFSQSREKMAFKVLDIEGDPKTQGFCPHTYDIVIAANVIHATKSVLETLRNVRHLLKQGGWLLLSETFVQQRHYDISVGYLDGFWKFTDFNIRQNSCMLKHTEWERLLHTVDFISAETTGIFCNHFGVIEAEVSKIIPQYVNPSEIGHHLPWFLLSDDQDVCNDLELYLKLAGESVIVIHYSNTFQSTSSLEYSLNPCNKNEFQKLFSCLKSTGYHPKGIIYAWSMIPKLNSYEISKGFLYFLQSLTAEYNEIPPLYILTVGQSYISDEVVTIPNAAPLFGFSRSYRAEYPSAFCKNIDLPFENSKEHFLPQFILQELWTTSEEPIVAIRNGKRYVARLQHLISSAHYPPLKLPQSAGFILDTTEINSIADLKFKANTQRDLGSHEIKILVKAAGLNFRDFVSTIRAKEELSIAIGGDFSGIVIEIGRDVKTRNVGDAVSGINFESEALPSHVIAQENEVWSLPPTMTFLEGATLGIPFFTAMHCLVTLGNLKPSETILIHTAAGGVGLCAIQIAKFIGAVVIATAGSNRKRSYLKSIGVAAVYSSRDTTYGEGVLRNTKGQGVDLVLNSLTGKGFKEATLNCCSKNSRFIEMSKLNIWTTEDVQLLRPDVKYIIDDIMLFNTQERQFFVKKLEEFILSGKIHPLPLAQFESTDIRQALTYFNKPQHIGKIVCKMPCNTSINGISKYTHELFNDRSTYIVTGGLQGVGLAVAKWMTTEGAKNIVLCGRSRPTDKNFQQIADINKTGKNLVIKQIDVGVKEEVKFLFDSITNGSLKLPPLRGVMHAAGCLADDTILNQTWETFEMTYQAKVKGGWHLHEETKNLNLEHFVLFSTVSAALGRHGQSNHTAANSYLDGLAKYRNSIGLPATSINWGQWGEDGIAVNMRLRAMVPFSTLKGTNAIAHVLQKHFSNVIASDGDINIWLEISPWAKLYLSELNRNKTSEISGKKTLLSLDTFWDEIKEAILPTEKMKTIQYFLAIILCDILEVKNTETFKLTTNLEDMGLDSLMKIQLRNSIQRLLGSKYSFTSSMLAECATFESLVEKIYDILHTKQIQRESEKQTEKNNLIKQDCILWNHIKPADSLSCKSEADIHVVLLTGVTGNLGPYVLKKLSNMNQIEKIYCLVRSTENMSCDERLKTHLNQVTMTCGIELSKVHVINGNLLKKNLGLEEGEFERLASEVHAVVNLAVASNHLEEYETKNSNSTSLRENNVIGTQRILEFIVASKTKYLLHASTIAAMWRADKSGQISETWPLEDEFEASPNFGYALSKYVSDRIISQAVDQGIPCKVIRFPIIIGEAKSGKQNFESNHFFMRYLSYIKTGKIPSLDVPLNILPVDLCADLSIDVFLNQNAQPGVYNLFHPITVNEKEIAAIAQELGCSTEFVEYGDFLKSATSDPLSLISGFIEFYQDKNRFLKLVTTDICRQWKSASEPRRYFKSQKLEKLLPVTYLTIEDPLIYLKRCILYAQNNYRSLF